MADTEIVPGIQWRIAAGDPASERVLAEKLGLNPLVARLLANRGIRTAEDAVEFMNPSRAQMHSPFLFQNMDKAVARIRLALDRNEKIFIFGDRDVDGVCGTAILRIVLQAFGAAVDSHVPVGKEGYGVHPDVMARAISEKFTLGITVDTGIAELERVEEANAGGMDVIIADHHQQRETLPAAHAILHPGLSGEPYPFKHLSGAGVAFKLAMALLAAKSPAGRRLENFFTDLDVELAVFYDRLMPLAALAAVADMMPLLGENRPIVSEGLRLMRESPPDGLKQLLEVLKLPEPTSKDLAFLLGPLLNAPGRLGDATPSLRLLTARSQSEASGLAGELIRLNAERKELVKSNFSRIKDILPAQNDLDRDRILCVSAEGVPPGVTGIVASRIKAETGRPVVIVLVEDGRGVGSGRSIESLNLVEVIGECSDLLEKFGGHHQAVGLTVRPENIEAFFAKLKERVAGRIEKMPEAALDIDAELDLRDLTLESLTEVSRLEPFGKGNPFPRFALRGAPVAECRLIGEDGKHLRLRIGKSARQAVTAVGWNMKDAAADMTARMDLAFEIQKNIWKGRTDIQLVLEDIRKAEGK